MPNLLSRLEHYTGERPLFDLYNVEPEVEKALARRVDLKSGGYLIIDQTEAMTTIDVNTGGFVGVITSYSIHYTKLYDRSCAARRSLRY